MSSVEFFARGRGRRRVLSISSALMMSLVTIACTSEPATTITQTRPDFTGVWGSYDGPDESERDSAVALLRPEARALVEEYRALVEPTGDTPGGYCLGYGMPGAMLRSGGYPMEIVQHDEIILVIYEAHSQVRRIYLSNRAAEADLFPDRNGYSFGRWEGDRLIVETTHLKEAVDQRDFPHSDHASIVEEYELLTMEDGSKVLVNDMTLTDPVFYTEPVRGQKKWTFLPGTRSLPYECNEPLWHAHLDALRSGHSADE